MEVEILAFETGGPTWRQVNQCDIEAVSYQIELSDRLEQLFREANLVASGGTGIELRGQLNLSSGR